MANIKKKYTVKITVEGKPYWIRGDTIEEAREKAALKKEKLEAEAKAVNSDMLVRDWCYIWHETYKRGVVNGQNFRDIKTVIDKYIVPAIGVKRVKSVRPFDLQMILNGLTRQKSTSYIKKIKQIVEQIFREAYNNDLISKDVAKGLKCPPGKAAVPRRAITDRERELTLKAAETSRGGLFILIMLFCGLRPGEVCALKWSDIDLEKSVIHVSRAVKADNTVGSPKSKAGIRDVPIPDYLLEKLSAIDHGPWDYVVTNTRGERLSKASYRNLWEEFENDLNIAAGCRVVDGKPQPPLWVADDLTLYCYRHTYCTDLQAAGVPINVAKELMGHEDISVTANIYTHGSDAAFEDARQKIASYQASQSARA